MSQRSGNLVHRVSLQLFLDMLVSLEYALMIKSLGRIIKLAYLQGLQAFLI